MNSPEKFPDELNVADFCDALRSEGLALPKVRATDDRNSAVKPERFAVDTERRKSENRVAQESSR